MTNPKKAIDEEIIRMREDLTELEVGSEEHLNACKALNQLSEAAGKSKKVDWNALIPGACSIVMFLLYMGFSETHITDTRAIQFAKGLFKR